MIDSVETEETDVESRVRHEYFESLFCIYQKQNPGLENAWHFARALVRSTNDPIDPERLAEWQRRREERSKICRYVGASPLDLTREQRVQDYEQQAQAEEAKQQAAKPDKRRSPLSHKPEKCLVPGCLRYECSRGLCRYHYDVWRKQHHAPLWRVLDKLILEPDPRGGGRGRRRNRSRQQQVG